MPRPVPRRHLHNPPDTQALSIRGEDRLPTTQITQHEHHTDLVGQQNDRIETIERQLRELATEVQALANRESVVVQDMSLDEATHKRLDAFHARLDEFQAEIDRMQRATLSADDANSVVSGLDERVKKLVDAGLATSRDELQRMKIQISSHKRSEGQDLAEEVELLSNMVSETSKWVLHFKDRSDMLEGKVRQAEARITAVRDEFLGDLSASLMETARTLQGNKAA